MSIKPQHATPADWAWLEGDSTVDRCDAAWSRGLIELRARVEALEAGATCPHVRTSDEGTSYCALAEQTQDKLDRLIEMDHAAACVVPPVNCRQRLQREGKPYPKSGCESCGDMSPLWRQCNASLEIEAARPAPASSLVERVADAIVTKATSAGIVDDRPARAAIREVAAWLRDRNGYPWAWVAQILEMEADR
jgi:hypothetical protein